MTPASSATANAPLHAPAGGAQAPRLAAATSRLANSTVMGRIWPLASPLDTLGLSAFSLLSAGAWEKAVDEHRASIAATIGISRFVCMEILLVSIEFERLRRA